MYLCFKKTHQLVASSTLFYKAIHASCTTSVLCKSFSKNASFFANAIFSAKADAKIAQKKLPSK